MQYGGFFEVMSWTAYYNTCVCVCVCVQKIILAPLYKHYYAL